MPIYEYSCEKCGVFDHMQKITDKPLKKCPTCGTKVAKLMSNTAFQLKGSGWYITDYGRKGSSGAESKAESGSSSPAASADAGTASESKPTGTKKSGGKGSGKGGDAKGSGTTAAA